MSASPRRCLAYICFNLSIWAICLLSFRKTLTRSNSSLTFRDTCCIRRRSGLLDLLFWFIFGNFDCSLFLKCLSQNRFAATIWRSAGGIVAAPGWGN